VARLRAAAPAAAFVALLGAIGAIAFVAAGDDDPPPSTTTTTTTVRAATPDEVAEALTVALSRDLEVPLDGMEAACVAGGVLEQLGQDRLEELADAAATVDALSAEEQEGLVRAVVVCVPPEKAEALLSTKPPPPTVGGLPDEGGQP
jgi:hypothetical protein